MLGRHAELWLCVQMFFNLKSALELIQSILDGLISSRNCYQPNHEEKLRVHSIITSSPWRGSSTVLSAIRLALSILRNNKN